MVKLRVEANRKMRRTFMSVDTRDVLVRSVWKKRGHLNQKHNVRCPLVALSLTDRSYYADNL